MGETKILLDTLMKEWSESHKQRKWTTFISDGVVNENKYLNSSPKICFFLKEAYSKESVGDWNLTEWLSEGAMTRMWSTVAEWTYGLTHTTSNSIPQRPQLSTAEKAELLQSIAIVNVKKSNGAVQSDYHDLLQYANADREFLKQELSILKPDIIVCGNNSSMLRLLYGSTIQQNGKVSANGDIDYAFMSRNGYALLGNQIILDYYHPANQYPAIMNYYTVCSLYQQALNLKG